MPRTNHQSRWNRANYLKTTVLVNGFPVYWPEDDEELLRLVECERAETTEEEDKTT